MRTTIDLPTRLLRQARKRAGDSGKTLSALIADALLAFLIPVREPEVPFQILTFGTPGGRVPTAAEVEGVLEAEDRERVLRLAAT